MMMMDVIGVVIAAVAAAGAFATTRGAMQLKVLETIRAERLDLEKEKTAKERYYRELAEGEVKRLREVQEYVCVNLESAAEKLQGVEIKMDKRFEEMNKYIQEIDDQEQRIQNLADKIEEHCGIKVPRPE